MVALTASRAVNDDAAGPRMCRAVISGYSRPLSFVDAQRPPGETRSRANEVAAPLQGDTASGLGVLQLIEVGEVAIDQDGVGQRPEVFGRLELRGIRRQEEEMHLLGDAQAHARVPARLIEHQHDLFGQPCSHLRREGGQLSFEELDADG